MGRLENPCRALIFGKTRGNFAAELLTAEAREHPAQQAALSAADRRSRCDARGAMRSRLTPRFACGTRKLGGVTRGVLGATFNGGTRRSLGLRLAFPPQHAPADVSQEKF